jgi:TRAP-type mannitol/chloroaromatic compound transport system permease small subunit
LLRKTPAAKARSRDRYHPGQAHSSSGRSARESLTPQALTLLKVAPSTADKKSRTGLNRPCVFGGNRLQSLLHISQLIDRLNEKIGAAANLAVLLACLISAGNAMVRYAFDYSSNGWLEIQWYLFAFMVMFGASYTLRRNEHVRVEIFYLFLSERGQLWLDMIGAVVFLIPVCVILSLLAWPFFMQSFSVNEYSPNANGLIRWPIKLVLPLGFALLALQGVSEIIKRAGALKGYVEIDAKYERPQQ